MKKIRTQLDDLNDEIARQEKIMLKAFRENNVNVFNEAYDKRSEAISIKINIY